MTKELHLLILEDRAADAELMLREVRGEGIPCTAKRVWTEEGFLLELRTHQPDLILADYALPSYDGLSALVIARKETPEVPFIFVSGTLGEERAIDALHHGAMDYIVKQRLGRLGPAVRRALREVEEVRERKQAEEALRENEAKYQRLYGSMMDAFVSVDIRGRIQESNRAYQDLLGYSEEELRQLTYQDLTPEKWHAYEARIVEEQILTRGDSGVYEKEYRRKDGMVFPVEFRTFVLRDSAGRPAGMWGIVRDITRRKQAETALRDAEALYHSLVEHLPQCIFRKDCDGRFTYANELFCALLSKPADEILGKTCFDFYPADLAERYRLSDEQVIRTGEIFRAVEENQPPGKPMAVVQIAKSPVRSASGEVIGVQGIYTDITSQRELEAKFLRAQRLESIGSLASGIAHDLNNILTPILICVPMLRTEPSEDERAKLASTIEGSTRRAVSVVRQLLTIGRGKEGRKVPIQIGHLVREMGKIIQETFPRSIQAEENLSPDLWPVVGDATQLHQILLNLCINARDAMPAGGCLSISVENVLVDAHFAAMHPDAHVGPFVRLRVIDTGTGIPESIRERIFDPFFTTKDQDHGTGLGLTTVLGIVKNHGGFITFTTSANRGTTFEIHLPAQPDAEELRSGEQAGKAAPMGRGETVLIVDDEEAIREATRMTLERHGYEVLAAVDGIEALAHYHARSTAVRAVVTDLFMPLMDGLTLCRILRRLDPALPIIISTAASSGSDDGRTASVLRELEIRRVLDKPHNAETLLSAVHQVLSGASVAASPTAAGHGAPNSRPTRPSA